MDGWMYLFWLDILCGYLFEYSGVGIWYLVFDIWDLGFGISDLGYKF